MDSPIQSLPENQTSLKRMVIMLLLAFLGAQLNLLGLFVALLAGMTLSPFFGSSPQIAQGIIFLFLAVLLLLSSFLLFSLYPEHGRRQFITGFLAMVGWPIWLIIAINLINLFGLKSNVLPFYAFGMGALGTGIGIAIAICLLVSGKLKSRTELARLVVGLIIGIGIHSIFQYDLSIFDFSPIWLSAMFFLEILRRRANRQAVLVGALLWIGLMILSFYLAGTFEKILF